MYFCSSLDNKLITYQWLVLTYHSIEDAIDSKISLASILTAKMKIKVSLAPLCTLSILLLSSVGSTKLFNSSPPMLPGLLLWETLVYVKS